MTIKLNHTNLVLRPSTISDFFDCSYKWGKRFLEGTAETVNSRAAIGTAIHAGVEEMWKDAIHTGKVDDNRAKLTDAAMVAWDKETKHGVNYGDGEHAGTAAADIIRGLDAFMEDIVPYTDIPVAVEKRYTVEIADHPLVTAVSGSVDYITKDTIADVKTSKRKIGIWSHNIQQSTYKYLAKANGVDVQHNLIQGVVLLKNEARGEILDIPTDENRAKYLINSMLDTLELVAKDVAPIHHLLRGNPKHAFCSHRFCPEFSTCPYVNGELDAN